MEETGGNLDSCVKVVVAGVCGIVMAIVNVERESGNILHSSTVENGQDWRKGKTPSMQEVMVGYDGNGECR
jgi:hypothetical protein